ncbi:MAG: PEP-CTERM sorting domain-containing protein [Limisphaerales bacterium]
MKTRIYSLLALWLTAVCALGQGTLIYDQQSASSDVYGGESPSIIQNNEPLGQSFTPTLSSIGFIRLETEDGFYLNSIGATLSVNLWAGSIEGSGTLLGSTIPVFLPGGFGFLPGGSGTGGFTNFFFSTPIVVTPGETYYFQPVVQSGDRWAIFPSFNYPPYSGGTAYYNGVASPARDLWFREGTYIVPEPSSSWLVLLGSGVLIYVRKRLKR